VVTVLGSCRQDSLDELLKVTAIKSGLTYPHYANEILQLVRFLKGRRKSFQSPYVFRNDSIGVAKVSSSYSRRAFRKTQVFVIEVASRWEYLHKGDYIHHVAYDSPELLPATIRNPKDLDGIVRRKQSYEELTEVLNLIVEELSGKAIVFVTNISTSDGSERAHLNSFISAFAKQRGVGFYDPSELLERHRLEDICKVEPVISHFTKFGHSLVGSKLKLKILEQLALNSGNNLSLTQTYQAGDKPEEIHGLGDFIFGCLTVFENANRNMLIPRVDVSNHPIGKHFTETGGEQKVKSPVVRNYHGDSNDAFRRAGAVFTNKRPNEAPSSEALDWLRSDALPFGRDLLIAAEEALSVLQLEERAFFGIHVRLGDECLLGHNMNRKLVESSYELVNRISSNIQPFSEVLLVSDSVALNEMFSGSSVKVLPSQPVHLGKQGNVPGDVQATLVEFLLLSKARHIVQISSYAWGSGFSEAAGIYGGVGLSRVEI
jgi:hypothetical protein